MTHDVYIPGDVSEGGCGQSYAEACSQLLAGILQLVFWQDTTPMAQSLLIRKTVCFTIV